MRVNGVNASSSKTEDRPVSWEARVDGVALYQDMLAVNGYLEADDSDAAREALEELVVRFQAEWSARAFASACFVRLGDQERGLIEAGLALALDPGNHAMFRVLAAFLHRQGQMEAANRVLEQGWACAKKQYHKRQWDDERALYFAWSDEDLPPHLAARRKRERAEMQASVEHARSSMGHTDQ